MDENELQRLLNHASAGGRHAALQEVVALLRTKAGQHFASGRDVEAQLTRTLSQDVEQLRIVAAQELQEHIDQRFRNE